jgi:uncharacterized protein YdaU (DUF1376 family)
VTPRPWLPLYCADYLGDTAHLTVAQSGAYLHLLMAMWLAGGYLPNDEVKLARCARVSLWVWRKSIAAEIMPLLMVTEQGVTQKRLQAELIKCQSISVARSSVARSKHLKNNDPPSAIADTITTTSTITATESESVTTSREKGETNGSGDRAYAWKGKVIRLTQADYNSWKRAFSNLNLDAELISRDAWLCEQTDRKNWFARTARHFANLNAKATERAAREKELQAEKDDPLYGCFGVGHRSRS